MTLAAVAVTALTIAFSPGNGAASTRHTLHCGPVGGTLPRAADACTRLARLDAPFAPVPPGRMCSQIFGGHQVAHVSGMFRGHPVSATFNRRDGCEIARWNHVGFLFR